MFRSSDVRRVKAAMDAAIPAPYEADVVMERGGLDITATLTDHATGKMIASCLWTFQPLKKGSKLKIEQPSKDEIKHIANRFAALCAEFPARMKREEAEIAVRQAADAANRAAREADAEARAEAERRLKSSAAKVLGATELTPAMVDAIQNAASDPYLG